MKRLKVAGVFFCIALCMTGCSARGPHFLPSGYNSGFDIDEDIPFSEYVRHYRDVIAEGRLDLTDGNMERVINANSPFELIPDPEIFPPDENGGYENGILLIHGLSDSPYEMRPLARHFQSRGFLVRTVLLPGHGTVPGDLLEVNYADWVKTAEYGIRSFDRAVENLYIGGYSTGGALAIHQALKGETFKGLFLFSPVFEINTPFAFLADTFLAPQWLTRKKENDYVRYESLCANAAAQVHLLTEEVEDLLESVQALDIPSFVALSEDDITVSSEETISDFNRYLTSGKSRMLIYTTEPGRDVKDKTGRTVLIDSRIPEERIVSFSHMSILVPPDDPHYGKNGEYAKMREAESKLAKEKIFFGELRWKFKQKFTMRRLKYNPFFEEMTDYIDMFLDSL